MLVLLDRDTYRETSASESVRQANAIPEPAPLPLGHLEFAVAAAFVSRFAALFRPVAPAPRKAPTLARRFPQNRFHFLRRCLHLRLRLNQPPLPPAPPAPAPLHLRHLSRELSSRARRKATAPTETSDRNLHTLFMFPPFMNRFNTTIFSPRLCFGCRAPIPSSGRKCVCLSPSKSNAGGTALQTFKDFRINPFFPHRLTAKIAEVGAKNCVPSMVFFEHNSRWC